MNGGFGVTFITVRNLHNRMRSIVLFHGADIFPVGAVTVEHPVIAEFLVRAHFHRKFNGKLALDELCRCFYTTNIILFRKMGVRLCAWLAGNSNQLFRIGFGNIFFSILLMMVFA